MGGLRRHDSPVGVKKGHVGFAEGFVSGYSRPLTNEEHWVLYYFEIHAVECKTCYDPLKVSKTGAQLCDDGHELAVDVANLLFNLRDGKIYTRSKTERQEVCVEVPSGYKHIMRLFKAIQNSSSFLKQSRPNYPIQQRTPRPSRRHDELPAQLPKHSTRVVDPTIPEAVRRRKSVHTSDADKAKRGSIYEDDLADLEEARLRERQARYSYEVREPSYYR